MHMKPPPKFAADMKEMNNDPKRITLGELLTDEQGEHVCKLMLQHDDEIELTRALKAYLNQFSAELEAKGVLPDYLAYVLLAYKLGFRNNV